jgi:hypothetical protein
MTDGTTPLQLDAVKPPRYEASRTAWLLTFIDLTSILVGFFVLIFSTQTIDRKTWTDMTQGFHAAFTQQQGIVVPVTPDGVNNALVVTTGITSGLGYLDALLHQQLGKDPVWGRLVAKSTGNRWTREMYYDLPQGLDDLKQADTEKAWRRLGEVMRGWKNPIIVRYVVSQDTSAKEMAAVTQRAVALAALLNRSGIGRIVGEVRVNGTPGMYLVVEAE